MILAMENAGQLIEEEELREQIRGSGIGTSATRAEILKKLFNNDYLRLNSKTQVITPSQTGEMIFDTCSCALKPLLDPRLTASWELGLTQVAGGTVTSEEYTQKLNSFITRRTNYIKETDFHGILAQQYAHDASLYPEKPSASGGGPEVVPLTDSSGKSSGNPPGIRQTFFTESIREIFREQFLKGKHQALPVLRFRIRCPVKRPPGPVRPAKTAGNNR